MLHFTKKYLWILTCLLAIYSCSNEVESFELAEENQLIKEQQRIIVENENAWSAAEKLTFYDNDFLQTKQPMSEDAIDLVDYETGLAGDRPYNRQVYMAAIERLKRYSSVKNNQIYARVRSGAEINIAEDLFDYLK